MQSVEVPAPTTSFLSLQQVHAQGQADVVGQQGLGV